VTGGVLIYPGAGQRLRAERDDLHACRLDVLDHDIEVELLRSSRIWPPRRLVIRSALKRDAGRCVALRDDDPVLARVRDLKAKQFGVEAREGRWLWAVDDHVMEAPDHVASISQLCRLQARQAWQTSAAPWRDRLTCRFQ
jgi:hypothetical protein